MSHKIVSTSGAAEQSIIDVDEVYLKWEFDPEEDGIEIIDANTFRQSVRRSEGREKARDIQMRQLLANAGMQPSSSAPRVPEISIVGETPPSVLTSQEDITILPQQKRSASSSPLPVQSVQKRRKLDANAPTHDPWDDPQPIAGPSRLAHLYSPSTSTTPPSPRPKAVALTAAATAQGPSPSPKRHLEVIELSSDDEEVVKILTPRKKIKTDPVCEPIELFSSDEDMAEASDFHVNPKLEIVHIVESEPPSSDDDDDGTGWNWDTIGDILDSERWKASKLIDADDDEINVDISGLRITGPARSQSPPVPYIRRPDTSRFRAFPPRGRPDKIEFIWDKLRAIENLTFRKRYTHSFAQPFYKRPWKTDFHMFDLKCEHSFKKAPGCINRIEQSGQWTVIGSASIGGLPDGVPIDPGSAAQNRPGSLMTWRNPSGLDTPIGHWSRKSTETGAAIFKYYAVHDVKFDPHSVAFASTGADRRLRIWTLRDEEEADEQLPAPENVLDAQSTSRWKNSDTKSFQRTPHEIVFNPKSSMLAVAEKKVHICKFTEDAEESFSFRLHGPRDQHIIGTMAWGLGPTANQLFASSEPDPVATEIRPIFDGLHVLYCPKKERVLVEFDAKEAGDTLTVNTSGDMMALCTRGEENRHILRLYDVGRQRREATAAVQLSYFPKCHENFEGEVNCATFSPDGLYLALGRNDNHVHVYDVRMLHRGPIFDYEHFGESKVTVREISYGVSKVHWMHSVQTSRMALLSGGEDGCVRLWDPTQASGRREDTGAVVATMNSDIMHFSYGNRYAGENVLVVGDADGEVRIFNDIL